MIPVSEENTIGLEKYYKYVLVCDICKKKFGADLKQKYPHCPVCTIKLKEEKYKK